MSNTLRCFLFASCLGLLSEKVVAQAWISVSPSSTTTRSFNGSGPADTSGIPWSWYLPFPNSNTGVQDGSCSATANPSFRWWAFGPYDDVAEVVNANETVKGFN